MRLRFQNLFSLLILSCFVPVSFLTPVGFVSPVDLVLFALILFCLYVGPATPKNPFFLFLSFLCLFSVIVAQVLASGISGKDVSTYIKFVEFFAFFPLIFSSVRISDETRRKLPIIAAKALRNGGIFLSLIAIFSALTRAGGLGSKAELYFLGSEYHKNFAGALLVFGASGAAYLSIRQNARNYFAFSFILLSTLLIEARASFLTEIVIFVFMYAAVHNAYRIFWSMMIGGVALAVAFIIASSLPMFQYYFERLASALSTDSSEVTSSTSRLLLWKYGLAGIYDKPLIGHGWGNFAFSGNTVNWLQGKKEPHNVFIQVLYSGGLLCLVPFILFFFMSIRLCLKRTAAPLFAFVPLGYFFAVQFGPAFVRGDTHLLLILICTGVFLLRTEKSSAPVIPILDQEARQQDFTNSPA